MCVGFTGAQFLCGEVRRHPLHHPIERAILAEHMRTPSECAFPRRVALRDNSTNRLRREMAENSVPPTHHIARICRAQDLFLMNGKPVRAQESAFRPRSNEETSLLAYWLEWYGGDRDHNIMAMLNAVKQQVRNSYCLAILNVGVLSEMGIEVVQAPEYELPSQTNAASVEMRSTD
jgi:hypothetical protein